MPERENLTPDFSDVPSLGDTQGLETYMNNQALQSQGIQPVEQESTETQQPVEQTQQQQQSIDPAYVARLEEQIRTINAQLDAQRNVRQQAPQQAQYSAGEARFVQEALARGYNMQQINDTIARNRQRHAASNGYNAALEQRLASLENYLREQEYRQAESVFIDGLTNFGNKWGLTEQDLVTFGNTALSKGINIATPGIDLEAVFRAVYPEQYAIRSQRMTPTNSSQIYGGTSIPEGNRQQASRVEDAYVEAFLKQSMPNQYGMLNKK